MATKHKEFSNIEIIRTFVQQLDENLDEFVRKCQKLEVDDSEALEKLKDYVEQMVGDVKHFIKNFHMTDNIVSVKNGKPALRGNQTLREEQKFFKEHAPQTDPSKTRRFIPYLKYVKLVQIENLRREKTGEPPLHDISEPTYNNWKKKI